MFLDYINDLVHLYKGKYGDPFFMIAGDWNRSDIDEYLEDFPFLQKIVTPPTCSDKVLDIIYTNMGRSLVEMEVFPPLVPYRGRPGRPSDHNIVITKTVNTHLRVM